MQGFNVVKTHKGSIHYLPASGDISAYAGVDISFITNVDKHLLFITHLEATGVSEAQRE